MTLPQGDSRRAVWGKREKGKLGRLSWRFSNSTITAQKNQILWQRNVDRFEGFVLQALLIQMVGVNKGEHIILYSRGPLGGMMFSAKFAWLFKVRSIPFYSLPVI